MRTLVINIGNNKLVDNEINIIYDKCYNHFRDNVDNKIVINVAGEENFGGGGCFEYTAKQVNKHLDLIRDYIIEGLTDCYLDYDEDGNEIFTPKYTQIEQIKKYCEQNNNK